MQCPAAPSLHFGWDMSLPRQGGRPGGVGNQPTHLVGHCFPLGGMSRSDPNPNTGKTTVVPQTHLLFQALSGLDARKAVFLLKTCFGVGGFNEDFLHPG